MIKKVLLATMLAVLFAVPVFAATNSQDQTSLPDACNQMHDGNHQQMMQNNGTIAADQHTKMHGQMKNRPGMMQDNTMSQNCLNSSTPTE